MSRIRSLLGRDDDGRGRGPNDDAPIDADWLHLIDDERVRWVGRPSRFTIATALVGGAALVAAGVLLTLLFLPVVEGRGLPWWLGYAPLALAVLGVGRAAYAYLDWLRLLYVVTDEEIYVKRGLVSRDVTQIRLDRVQNTAYDQTVLERLLSYGDVRVFTAGTGTEDVTLRSVPNPETVKKTLTERLSEQSRHNPPRNGGV